MTSYNSTLQSNNTDLQEVLQILQNKASGGEQATPEISVSSNGLITAIAGTKSSTYQLAFQPAKTITPSTASQIAVSSGYYTGGDITVAGDSNLVAGNIKSGVSIFGVSGTAQVGGGTVVDDVSRAIIEGTITSIKDDSIKTIRNSAFYDCSNLTIVSFPACISIGEDAFRECHSLTTANFPACINIGSNAFTSCRSLITASFPACISIGSNTFTGCYSLTTASLPACTNIGGNAFYFCYRLTTVSFPACTSIGIGAFKNCSSLTTASFPACTNISSYAFEYCYSLTTANFPVCISIGSAVFYDCSNLTTVSFPACTNIGSNAFTSCSRLTTVNFPACTNIGNYAFSSCYRLSSLALGASSVCTLSASNAFFSTPFTGLSTNFKGTPHIYVPASLITAYQSATNWTYFSSYFSTIESLEV